MSVMVRLAVHGGAGGPVYVRGRLAGDDLPPLGAAHQVAALPRQPGQRGPGGARHHATVPAEPLRRQGEK